MQGDPRSHGLWERSAPPPPATAPLGRDTEAEVAVVGAGYTGLSAALHLAGGGASVAVLEGAEIGFGGSGRNVGLVNAGMWAMPDDLPAALGETHGQRLLDLFGSIEPALPRRRAWRWCTRARISGRFELADLVAPEVPSRARRAAREQLGAGALEHRLQGGVHLGGFARVLAHRGDDQVADVAHALARPAEGAQQEELGRGAQQVAGAEGPGGAGPGPLRPGARGLEGEPPGLQGRHRVRQQRRGGPQRQRAPLRVRQLAYRQRPERLRPGAGVVPLRALAEALVRPGAEGPGRVGQDHAVLCRAQLPEGPIGRGRRLPPGAGQAEGRSRAAPGHAIVSTARGCRRRGGWRVHREPMPGNP
ncbi:MAG: FAD-binding oxidoreductase, partial [Acetobacteraceae bacterium]|nr:FAD-binding oxidoreductase [Acetobacteraceae bacterium]